MEYQENINFKQYEDLDGFKVTTWKNNFHPIQGIVKETVNWKITELDGVTKTQFSIGFTPPKHTTTLTLDQAIGKYLEPYIEAHV